MTTTYDFLSPRALDRAHQLARKAIDLDPNLPEAHASLGFALIFSHEHDASVAAFEKAVTLNPSYVDWRFGYALVVAGQPRRAIDVLDAYMRLDPLYAPYASGYLGLAHYTLKQYARALTWLRDCVSWSPRTRWSHSWLAATCARLGRLDEARAEAAEVLRLYPNYTIGGTGRRITVFKSPEDDQHFFDGLRIAGLPE